jgi:hypothetical protein
VSDLTRVPSRSTQSTGRTALAAVSGAGTGMGKNVSFFSLGLGLV